MADLGREFTLRSKSPPLEAADQHQAAHLLELLILGPLIELVQFKCMRCSFLFCSL